MEIRHLASTTSSRSYTVANAPFWKSKRATHRSRHGFILTQCTLLPPVFGKFAHQLETRFGIEPRTSPWGTFQEYFGVFCLGLIRSTCFYWGVYVSDCSSQTLFVVYKGILRPAWDTRGLFFSTREIPYVTKQLWQDEDEELGQGAPLSLSLMKNTWGPVFWVLRIYGGEVKDLTLILVELYIITDFEGETSRLKKCQCVELVRQSIFFCPLRGYKCSSLAIACVVRWDNWAQVSHGCAINSDCCRIDQRHKNRQQLNVRSTLKKNYICFKMQAINMTTMMNS